MKTKILNHFTCYDFDFEANKPGWDVKSAFGVFLRANKIYWYQYTIFNDGACGVEQAARDLNLKWEDVRDAFAQVGVFCCMYASL